MRNRAAVSADLDRLVDDAYTGSVTLQIVDGSVTRIERRSEHKIGRLSSQESAAGRRREAPPSELRDLEEGKR